jgi:2-dehydro-3-deoxyphosphogluconate aldolase/(4S)-4-hydroxy-2-oxoglutarate aldolase
MNPTASIGLSPEFAAFPLIGILRGFPLELTAEIGAAVKGTELAAIEVTLNSPGALDQIRVLRQCVGPGIAVGAGTVLDADAARSALAAGAHFLVSPALDPGVMASGREAGVALFPGALTPTEVVAAWRAGATMVKVFPAQPLGPSYIKALKAPLGQIPLLPTGGIGLETLGAYLEAGADGVGVGEPLFEKARILARDWDWLRGRIGQFRAVFVARGKGP